MEEQKIAYTEILEVCNKHQDPDLGDIREMAGKAKKHLFGIELSEKYGLNIDHNRIGNLEYYRVSDYLFLGWYGEKYNRTISWEVDGKQPVDEFLLQISFSTGAYIFGEDYPEEIFKEFFEELKTYSPKYCDMTNHCLYFSMDNAGKVFNEFGKILQNYHQKNREDLKGRKIKKLQAELEKLSAS